nr:DMT family transporter [uncultured Gellertiella sp.]
MQNRTMLGVLFLCIGVLVFSLQDAIIKKVSGSYALSEVVSIRCLVSVPILFVIVHWEAGLSALRSRNFRALLFRAAIMLCAYTTYYLAFPALKLADAVALYFTVPLFMLAMAAMFLGEKVGWRRISAVLIGFAGVIVMLRPGAGVFEPAALLSLFSAATYGFSMLMARKLGCEEKASVMAFYQNGVYLAGALGFALVLHLTGTHSAHHPSLNFLVRPWTMPPTGDFLLIASCGVIAAIGMMFLTHAYRIAKASIVVSFEYTGLLWSPLWGFLFFGEVPYITTLYGAALIIGGGLFALTSPAARDDAAEAGQAT